MKMSLPIAAAAWGIIAAGCAQHDNMPPPMSTPDVPTTPPAAAPGSPAPDSAPQTPPSGPAPPSSASG